MANISQDLVWEIVRPYSSTLVKRTQAGGVQFSSCPLNLRNTYSRKYEGLVSDKAIGVQEGENGSIQLITKKNDKSHQPATKNQVSTFSKSRSNRKVYSAIVNSTTKRNYRPDLRKDAVARASAIRRSQKPVKESKPQKPRGAKARAE
ncbi:60S ribosomal protein-like protein L28 [Corynespora cassiicola Philippines]|uniref:60S ribosomal protein-like protein L28 n=1 Tax=Corynespora cassiicola Philippines TaxID=1448308 RepID=A0A2T2P037_CORCC|nr:60S ribosomal protein-like protein L28 [Corynespora cassiicola Philippines]